MTGPGPENGAPEPASGKFGDLSTRILSALVISAVALGCVWMGGWFSTVLIIGAGAAMLFELAAMTTGPLHGAARKLGAEEGILIAGMAVGAALMQLSMAGWGSIAVSLSVIGAAIWTARHLGGRPVARAAQGFVLVAVVALVIFALDDVIAADIKIAITALAAIGWAAFRGGEHRARIAVLLIGGAYISAAVLCFVALRAVDPFGFVSILWAALVVVAADVGGYFAGRIIGGPRLWPRVSPKKTWSGMAGGVVLAAVVGIFFSWATTGTYFYEVASVSMVAAILAQGGDLAESAVKRRFGVKDASGLIPGHGGVLDRLDGHIAAILVAAAVTFSRGQPVFVW